MNDTTQDFPTTGDLRNTPLTELLEQITGSGATGTLALRHDNVVKAIYIDKGELVFATSTHKNDRLGEMLVRHGVISQSALTATTKVMRETGKREGETLVEMGILAPKALFEGLKLQVEEILISTFLWDSAEFQFKEGPLASSVIPIPIHLEQLLPKALDRMHPQ